MILVDTSVLSLLFRRRRRDLSRDELPMVYALEELARSGLMVIIGPVRQEILSGIVTNEQFAALQSRLTVIDDLPMDAGTFVLAAQFYNACRAAAVAPGDIDMMICAAANEHSCEIFSSDPDFMRYASVLPIRLYQP